MQHGMFGYMFFGMKGNKPFDAFYIKRTAGQAVMSHQREFGFTRFDKIEMIVLNPVPYWKGSECEVKLDNGREIVCHVGHGYSRCQNCMDFFKEDEIYCVEPFGLPGYQSACQGCIESEGFVRE